MQNNYYALAHEQASNERAEVRAQLEELLARDAKLEKLIGALKDVMPAEEHVAEQATGDVHAEAHEHAPEHAEA